MFWWYTPTYLFVAAVVAYMRGEKGKLTTGLVFVTLLLFVAMLIGYYRKRQRVKILPASGTEQIKLTPWKAIASIIIKPASKDCFRIRVRLINPAWRFKHDPVDAEVHCTREQAVQLNFMIENWRGRRA